MVLIPWRYYFFSWTGLNLNPFSFYLITDWASYRNGVPWPDVTLLSVHLAGRGRQVKHHKFQLPMQRHIECLSIVHLMVSLGCFRIQIVWCFVRTKTDNFVLTTKVGMGVICFKKITLKHINAMFVIIYYCKFF